MLLFKVYSSKKQTDVHAEMINTGGRGTRQLMSQKKPRLLSAKPKAQDERKVKSREDIKKGKRAKKGGN